jgi:hypothetical protein
MSVPTSEVGYTSATTGRKDHEVHKGHVVEMEKNIKFKTSARTDSSQPYQNIFITQPPNNKIQNLKEQNTAKAITLIPLLPTQTIHYPSP